MSDRVARLAAEAKAAAEIRALTTHPDVIALRVEKIRTQVDILLWSGIVLGLAFTMVNVQSFAATGTERYSLGWWAAWLLDPMVSLVLIAVLRAEQVTARYQVELPDWARRTKWLTFAATYTMNTWPYWGLAGQPLSPAGIVLHSVPPLVVFAAAETGPGLRDRLTEAVRRALAEHAEGTPQPGRRPIVADIVPAEWTGHVPAVPAASVPTEPAAPVPALVPAPVPVPVPAEPAGTEDAVPAPVPTVVPAPVPDSVPAPVPAAADTPMPDAVPAGTQSDQHEHNEPADTEAGTVPAEVPDKTILEWLREEAAKTGTVPGRKDTVKKWAIGSTRADRLRAEVPTPKALRRIK